MVKRKYRLPEISSLKEIGFTFEFLRLDEPLPFIKSFVENNIENLKFLYYPGQFFYDDDGNTVDAEFWGDPLLKEPELSEEPDIELIEKILRLERGEIKPTDYLFLVHPKDKRNHAALLKAANAKLRYIYASTGLLIYRIGIWNMGFMDSIKECLYHKVLDDLIRGIAEERIINPSPWSPEFKEYKKKRAKADEYKKEHDATKNYISIAARYWEADMELIKLNDDLFSTHKTLEKSARWMMRKAKIDGPILSSLENKEATIKYFLRLQAKDVRLVRDNHKSNKGINEGKKQLVLELYKSDPKKSITKIIKEISQSSPNVMVTRKTVAKYIKEYKMSKNNPLQATI